MEAVSGLDARTTEMEVEAEVGGMEEPEEREDKREQEGENGDGGDEAEGEEEEEGEGRCELNFGEGMDPIDLVQEAHDGVELYHCFERLEYEALAERKRKALQDRHQFPDRYAKQRLVNVLVYSGLVKREKYLCGLILVGLFLVMPGLSLSSC